MSWHIYKLTNKINGKIYIGQTKQNPELRWKQGYDFNDELNYELNEYGWNNFEKKILIKDIPYSHWADNLEKHYIYFYKYCKEELLYNCRLGKRYGNSDTWEYVVKFKDIDDLDNYEGFIYHILYEDEQKENEGFNYSTVMMDDCLLEAKIFLDDPHKGPWYMKIKEEYDSIDGNYAYFRFLKNGKNNKILRI